MTDIIPSIDDVMRRTAIGGGFHEWRTVGGAIRLTSAELRPILEDAYDSSMPDWVALADFEDELEDDDDPWGLYDAIADQSLSPADRNPSLCR